MISEEWWDGQVKLKAIEDAQKNLEKQIQARARKNPFRNAYQNIMKADSFIKKYGK
jgi:hypothetical protein